MSGIRCQAPSPEMAALQFSVRSAENLVALMVPEDRQSVHLQRLEDSDLRQMWRHINAFGKVRQGMLENKN